MTNSPALIRDYFVFLTAWDLVASLIAVLVVTSHLLDGWPRLARFGFTVACVGMLADACLLSHLFASPKYPYWSLKDLGLGFMTFSFAARFFADRRTKDE